MAQYSIVNGKLHVVKTVSQDVTVQFTRKQLVKQKQAIKDQCDYYVDARNVEIAEINDMIAQCDALGVIDDVNEV